MPSGGDDQFGLTKESLTVLRMRETLLTIRRKGPAPFNGVDPEPETPPETLPGVIDLNLAVRKRGQ